MLHKQDLAETWTYAGVGTAAGGAAVAVVAIIVDEDSLGTAGFLVGIIGLAGGVVARLVLEGEAEDARQDAFEVMTRIFDAGSPSLREGHAPAHAGMDLAAVGVNGRGHGRRRVKRMEVSLLDPVDVRVRPRARGCQPG